MLTIFRITNQSTCDISSSQDGLLNLQLCIKATPPDLCIDCHIRVVCCFCYYIMRRQSWNISCILLCFSEEYYCPFRKTKRNKRNKTNSILLFNSVNDLIFHCVQNHVTKAMPQKKHQNTRKPKRMNRWDKTWYFDDYIFKEVVETKQVKKKDSSCSAKSSSWT